MQQGQEFSPFEDDELRRALMNQGETSNLDWLNHGQNTGIIGGGSPTTPPVPAGSATVSPYERSAFRDEINGAEDGYAVAAKYGIKLDKAGRGVLPGEGGEIMDLIQGAGAGGKRGQWIGVGDKHGMYSTAGGGASPGAPAGPSGPAIPGGISDEIKKLLARGWATPSETDPEIAAQLAPQNRAIDRGSQRTRQAAAERAAQGGALVGGEGGSFDAAVNGINENAAGQKQSAAGDVIGKEVAGRRADIINALQFAQGEEKMALEKQLAEANNEIQRQSVANQGRSINNQNQQWYDKFGWDMSNSNNNSDDDMLARILGGLGR